MKETKKTLLSAAFAASALTPFGAMLLAPTDAHATCTLTGGGTFTDVQSNGTVTCVGSDTETIEAHSRTNIAVTIGNDATPTQLSASSVFDPFVIDFDDVTNSQINVLSNATLSGANNDFAIILRTGANNNVINIAQGANVSGNFFTIGLDDADGNTINVNGVVSVTSAAGSSAINITGVSGGNPTDNIINVGATGVISTLSSDTDQAAIYIQDGGANTIVNFGTIKAAVGPAIFDSNDGGETYVINAGSIEGGSGGVAIQFGDVGDTLELRAGWSITGQVDGGAGGDALILGGTADAAFDIGLFGVQFLNFNSLIKVGSSTWTLIGSGNPALDFSVQGGTLLLDGAIWQSGASVDPLGTLGGNGSVGYLETNGAVSPGLANGAVIGTINVTNPLQGLVFYPGSTYVVHLAPDGASDLLNVAGGASISDGTVHIIPTAPGGYLAGTQYTILTAANGVFGTFAGLTGLGGPLIDAQLSYDANNVYLTLLQVLNFASVAETPNQQAVADAFDAIQAGGSGSPDLNTAINTLAALSTDDLLAGLDDLAGQIHADGQHYVMGLGSGFHRFVASSTRNLDEDRRLWVGLYGDDSAQDGEAGFFGHGGDSFGGAIGARLWQGEHASAGAAIGYSSGEMSMDGQGDSLDADTLHLALYGDAKLGGFDLQGEASVGFASLSTSREIAFLTETASAEMDAQLRGLSLDVAYPIAIDGGFTLSPFALVEYFSIDRDGFTETGAPGVNLVLGDDSTESVDVTLGARGDVRGEFASGRAWRVGGRLAARMASDSEAQSFTTTFEGDPTVGFSILGLERPDMIGLYGLDADIALGAFGALRFSYDAAFGDGYDSQAIRASVNVGF